MSTLIVEVGGDDIRSDLKSHDVKKKYPLLPCSNSWSNHDIYVKQRTDYIAVRDTIAYKSIQHQFPDFKPPLQMKENISIRDHIVVFFENLLIK
jgi:hypothetical protein